MELRFLTEDLLLDIHELEIEERGGTPGLRDLECVRAVVHGVRQASRYTDDVFELAAAYVLYVTQRHPWIDGNKRSAYVACIRFLSWNGVATGHSEDALRQVIIAAADRTHATSREAIRDQLREIFG